MDVMLLFISRFQVVQKTLKKNPKKYRPKVDELVENRSKRQTNQPRKFWRMQKFQKKTKMWV